MGVAKVIPSERFISGQARLPIPQEFLGNRPLALLASYGEPGARGCIHAPRLCGQLKKLTAGLRDWPPKGAGFLNKKRSVEPCGVQLLVVDGESY